MKNKGISNETEKGQAEQNLLRTVLDILPDNIFVKDASGAYVASNEAHWKDLGADRAEDVLGLKSTDFFPPPLGQRYQEEDLQLMRQGQSIINREESRVDNDGKPKWLLTSKVPFRDSRDNILGLVGISRNITDRKKAEESLREANERLTEKEKNLRRALADLKQLHQHLKSTQLQLVEAEKMKSVGRLAAGVAHEVKNPLAVISMANEYLTKHLSGGRPSITAALDEIAQAVNRANDVILELLDFTSPRKIKRRNEKLGAVIDGALLLVRHNMENNHIKLACAVAPDLPPIPLDKNKMEQAFVNLFLNAIHAMQDGGSLTVRASIRELSGVGSNVGSSKTESFRVGDRLVQVDIEDTGKGIPPEDLGKIFDPFYTTNPTGTGTGLGLTVTRHIVDMHHGVIEISNREGGGARVTILLPTVKDNPIATEETGYGKEKDTHN